ncbi:hypothetical protein GGF32_007653 [Allomyces javanicus]|nr:hypothetical protein GGF32_007653 [Allomyces javanicus]
MVYTLRPGQSAAHYEVVSELGSGAFATVYACFDRRRPSTRAMAPLALKVISKHHLDDEQLQLTRLEADLHARLPHHKNIVQLVDRFEDAHALYLVLERCMHGDLYDLAVATKASKKPFPPTPAASPVSGFLAPLSSLTKSRTSSSGLPDHVVLRYMRQLTSALAACHRAGVYHRDLKPENVLLAGALDAAGYPLEAKLADFGLATRETFSTELGLGTRAYLAPECLDEAIDGYLSAPADVFALALVAVQVAHPGVRLWAATENSDPAWTQFAQAVRDARAGRRRSLSGTALSPALTHFFDRHAPQLAESVRALVVRACDPDPQHRASLSQFAQLLDAVASFKCHRTPALLAVARHDVRERVAGASPVNVPCTPPPTPLGVVVPSSLDELHSFSMVTHRLAGAGPAARTTTHWHDDEEDEDDWDHDHGDESSDDEHHRISDDEDVRPRWAPPAPVKVTVTPASPAKPLWTPPSKPATTTLGFATSKPASSLASSVDWSSLDDDDDEDDEDVGLGSSLASQLAAMSFKVTPAATAAPTTAAPAAKVTIDKARQESLDSALGNSLPAVPQAVAAAKGKYVPPSKRAQYASPVMTRIGGFLAPPARK